VKNRALAAAYAGAGRFGVEVFEPATSTSLMAAMLVHDLRNPKSSAQPQTELANPMDLFVIGANHGGLWRSAYAPRSVLGIAAVLGMFESRA
jgi:NAD(P)H-hydrate repair Nnr-like enzyme with NAD(P)H-hydrate dehydratase domain